MIQNHSKTGFSKFDHQLDIFNKNTSSTTHREVERREDVFSKEQVQQITDAFEECLWDGIRWGGRLMYEI